MNKYYVNKYIILNKSNLYFEVRKQQNPYFLCGYLLASQT